MLTRSTPAISALVLAGKRDGKLDPLAARFGTTHKCLVPVAGEPVITHVLRALSQAPQVSRIIVSIDDAATLMTVPLARTLIENGRLVVSPSRDNIADSVIEAGRQASFPLLITTADNALFTPEAVTLMQDAVLATGADAAAAFARKGDILAAHPDGQRRFYEFADDGYSNCNCYWISDADSLFASKIFGEGGQFAKHPWRMAKAFGILNLIRFRLGMGTLEQTLARFSKRLGLELHPVIFDDGSLAIDVDNDRTHAVVEQLLAARQARHAVNLTAA